jgi:hypothetical protein
MFCGWRQIFSKQRLVELGSGTLQLDLLREHCAFNELPIEPLPIMGELREWMVTDLAHNRIPLEAIDHVQLEAKLTFSSIDWNERSTNSQFFSPNGGEVRGGQMHRCKVECTSTVSSGDALYQGRYEDVEEWPSGWPAA